MLSLPVPQMVAGDPCHLCGEGVVQEPAVLRCPVCGWVEPVG